MAAGEAGSSSLGSGPSAAASPSQEAVETLCAGPSRSAWQWGEGLGGEVWGEGGGEDAEDTVGGVGRRWAGIETTASPM